MNHQDSEGKSLLVKTLEVLTAIRTCVKQNGCSSMLEDNHIDSLQTANGVFSSWYVTKHLWICNKLVSYTKLPSLCNLGSTTTSLF